jgi:hypothetical protein
MQGWRWHVHRKKASKEFVASPSSFKDGEYKAVLTEGQNARLLDYLRNGRYLPPELPNKGSPVQLLAFSFGQNPDANMQLATAVDNPIGELGSLRVVVVQWEIANILYERHRKDKEYRNRVKRIDPDCDRDYITSDEVVEKFKRSKGVKEREGTFVVCQAWHAPRCIDICVKNELPVVGREFVYDFSPSDPQKRVRNWLAWVLKEGTKK